MLQLVKWAYSLGVRNERHRIANYLQNAQAQRWDGIHDMERQLGVMRSKGENSDLTEIEKKMQRKIVIDREIIDIISGIFHAEEKYQRGESVMFPEGEGKQ